MTGWRAFGFAVALPVAFTLLVLLDVQRNRRGGRDAMELTEREVSLSAGTDQNSGATAQLKWSSDWTGGRWLSAEQLESIGFDVSAAPVTTAVVRTYSRQPPRRAYVVLELRSDQAMRSRLVPIDAGIDKAGLLKKYPDGRRYLVTGGVIALRFSGSVGERTGADGELISIDPPGIHIPAEFTERLRRGRRFTLTVQYGSHLEPWIVAVR
jgi:hypothetical protein